MVAITTVETNVELGREYKDEVTDLTGIAVGVVKHLHGCVRICLQPKANKEGVVPDSVWFDEMCLIDTETGERISPVREEEDEISDKPSKDTPGGPPTMGVKEPKR